MSLGGADLDKIQEIIKPLIDNGGRGIPPKNAKNLKATGFSGKAQLSWEIGDTIIEGQTICTLKGCIIRKKQGSPPTSVDDGTLVVNLNRRQAMSYSEVPYEDSQSIGTSNLWYYRLFFYSDQNVTNMSEENIVSITGTQRAKVWGFRQDFGNLNPDGQITYIEDNSGYVPAYHGSNSGITNGSWNNWEWLQGNLPYAVSFDSGQSIGALKKTNTSQYESDKQASLDGRTNGYFAWIPKIYWYEEYSGKVRTVKFSLTNRAPGTTKFRLPSVFRNKDGEELEGFWLPIYTVGNIRGWSYNTSHYEYNKLNDRVSIYIGGGGSRPQTGYGNLETYVNSLKEFVGDRFCILGGEFFTLFRDILYMLYRSSNLQGKYGNTSRTTWQDVSSEMSGEAGMGLSSNGYLDGRFMPGTMLFYSKAISGTTCPILDPYVYYDAESSWGSWRAWVGTFPNYILNIDKIKETYKNTGLEHPGGNGTERFYREMGFVEGFGSMVTNNTTGASSTTGLCASGYHYSSRGFMCRKRNVYDNTQNNINSIQTVTEDQLKGTLLVSVFPPVGYKPN